MLSRPLKVLGLRVDVPWLPLRLKLRDNFLKKKVFVCGNIGGGGILYIYIYVGLWNYSITCTYLK
jgi:hypothetical protein